MNNDKRFFVDERAGCIAVRDRTKTDPDYNGLDPDTPGVVKFWVAERINKKCPHCGHTRDCGFAIGPQTRKAAEMWADYFNQENSDV